MADDQDLKIKQAKEAAFAHPLFVPEDFKGWLEDTSLRVSTEFYTQDIQGLRGARWKSASPKVDPASCNITSGWGDCTDGEGPVITGLSNGIWLVLFGFAALDVFQHSSVIFVNDDYADGRGFGGNHDLNELLTSNGGSGMQAAVYTIDDHTIAFGGGQPLSTKALENNNKIAMKYNVSSASARFEKRWMHAIRVDELVRVIG
jgi:hypothetical protein